MSTKLSTTNRINITLALLAVFLLVLGTNRLDNQHFNTVQDALKTIYKDRVVAQDYLFQMNTIVHEKRMLYQSNNNIGVNPALNEDFSELTTLFNKTKLTSKEAYTLRILIEDIDRYKKQEEQFNKTLLTNPTAKPNQSFFETINELEKSIIKLSEIQVRETKRTIDLAQKSLDNTSMLATIEVWFLVIIGIAIQFVVFYRTSKKAAKEEQE